MARVNYKKIEVNFENMMLEVTGIYSRSTPATRETPEEPEEFEIETIKYNGFDITDLFYNLRETDEDLINAIFEQELL